MLDGVGATERIAREVPGTAILVLTTFADDDSILGALRAGARGYLTKDAGRAELAAAVPPSPAASRPSHPRSAPCS